ncbi:MAG: hypothetical protein ACREDT_17055, partial [Methylocella sp.]
TDSPSMSAQTSSVLGFQIEEGYRGGKPRMYLPFTGSDQIDTPRTFGDVYVAALQAAGASFIDDVNGLAPTGFDTVSIGVVHFFSGGVALAPPTFSPYLAVHAQKRICTQRRRLGAEI